ncbi:hypothetical protein BGZ60DRAFT_517898 [Tricladium varicosporioides]|nr:hypothetical protein BGZ60DRAFT_517898 [Hymenoscyphus varicosporioides]
MPSDLDKNDNSPTVFEVVPNINRLVKHKSNKNARYVTKDLSAKLSPFGGYLSAAQAANMAPADPLFQKAELLHFLSPSWFSIDGRNAPSVFFKEILGWLLQGTIMPELSVLSSFTIKNNIIGKDSIKTAQALALKGKIYALMKKVVGQNSQVVSEEAIQALLHLAAVEVLWGDHDIYSAHFKGIRGLLNAQGGVDSLKSPLLKQMIVVGDYQISIYGEHELLFHHPPPYEIGGAPIAVPYPEMFNSPLLYFSAKFVDIYSSLGLNFQITAILDDVREITLSVISSYALGVSSLGCSRNPRITSASIRIQELPVMETTNTSNDLDTIYEVCRMAALAYNFCITSQIPLSQGYFQDMAWLNDFRSRIWADYDLAISAMKSFYTVQRWLAKSRLSHKNETLEASP